MEKIEKEEQNINKKINNNFQNDSILSHEDNSATEMNKSQAYVQQDSPKPTLHYQSQIVQQQGKQRRSSLNSLYSDIYQIQKSQFLDNKVITMEQKSHVEWLIFDQVSYLINTSDSQQTNEEYKVERRFSDFDWLFQLLRHKYPGLILPPLPEKKVLSKLKIQTLNQTFLQTRKALLLLFLQKLTTHPELKHTEELRLFLTEHSQSFEKTKSRHQQQQHYQQNKQSILNQTLSLCSSYFKRNSVQTGESKQLYLAKTQLKLQEEEVKLQELYSYVRQSLEHQEACNKAQSQLSELFTQLHSQDVYFHQPLIQQLATTYQQLAQHSTQLLQHKIFHVKITLHQIIAHIHLALHILQNRDQQESHLHNIKSHNNTNPQTIAQTEQNLMTLSNYIQQDLHENFIPYMETNVKQIFSQLLEIDQNLVTQTKDIWKTNFAEYNLSKE